MGGEPLRRGEELAIEGDVAIDIGDTSLDYRDLRGLGELAEPVRYQREPWQDTVALHNHFIVGNICRPVHVELGQPRELRPVHILGRNHRRNLPELGRESYAL